MRTNNNGKNIDLKDFILHWNLEFPVDRWWRVKYGVAFNSPTHRESSFLNMLIEREEDNLYVESYKRIKSESVEEYSWSKGNWLKPEKYVESVTEDEFNELSLDDLQEVEDHG